MWSWEPTANHAFLCEVLLNEEYDDVPKTARRSVVVWLLETGLPIYSF